MSRKGSALLRACLLASVPIVTFAQTPVIVEAESQPETRGANLTTGTDATGVTYITTTENSAVNPTPARTATWNVNFPAAGNYALYVRIYVGPIGGADEASTFRAASITPPTGLVFTTPARVARISPTRVCPPGARRDRTSGNGFA